ncbi:hypothetical protein V8E54_000629 [Elaphomyces granulatus]
MADTDILVLAIAAPTLMLFLTIVGKKKLTPLSRAAEKGYKGVVKLLLENGAHPENEFGQTPLSRARLAGHTAVVKLLNSYCTPELPYNNPTPKAQLYRLITGY